jgi:hypothetical protein
MQWLTLLVLGFCGALLVAGGLGHHPRKKGVTILTGSLVDQSRFMVF